MREILFRGRNENSTWIYGSLLVDKDTFDKNAFIYYICDIDGYSTEIVNTKTIGQFTGLNDKNGTKIFEGDIVKGKSEYFGNGSLNQKAVVLYDRGQFLLSFGETFEECKQLNDFEVVGVWNGDVEVIGNVHDNPELLK